MKAATNGFPCENITIGANGHLYFAGQDTADLAREYGTPLYLMDEDRIRRNCRAYLEAFARNFPKGSRPFYASKACSFKAIYRIMKEEGMGADVVSCGEIVTATAAGFDLANTCFHSNNKTDADIRYAMEHGVGCFVVDSMEEVTAIEQIAAELGKKQKILLRLTPGIDPHTFEAVATGRVDSKFGTAIETGQAEKIVLYTLRQPHLKLAGFHCHIGSQIFRLEVYERALKVMLSFIRSMAYGHKYMAEELDIGGGFGVRYIGNEPVMDIGERVDAVAKMYHRICREMEVPEPVFMMEPGRSIVADAGMTLYTVGSVKEIRGYKNYISVDGGMTDNPRYALYGSRYICLPAERMYEQRTKKYSVVGRCCESGDIIQENVLMPEDMQRGDLLAVCTTGAYNYSMASNYNRIPRPPVVFLKDGKSEVVVRRESYEDLVRLDV